MAPAGAEREFDMLKAVIASATTMTVTTAAVGQTISLAGEADGSSRISEFDLTGAFAQIDFGDGGPGDADGAYSVADETGPFGSALDVFPNETNFGVGNLMFDDSTLTGFGVETLTIGAIDLGQLFTPASLTSDISGVALSNFFFSAPVDFVFGSLDASDTVTFTDGVLTSIDLSIDASFLVDLTFAGQGRSFDGAFSISGNRFSLFIDETEFNVPTVFGVAPQSRIVVDISGTVAAVIPAPGAAAFLAVAGAFAARRRRVTG